MHAQKKSEMEMADISSILEVFIERCTRHVIEKTSVTRRNRIIIFFMSNNFRKECIVD